MIECAFASQTPRGTKCIYTNEPCWADDGFTCETMKMAVNTFEGILSNMNEVNWSEEFMEGVVRKYGGGE